MNLFQTDADRNITTVSHDANMFYIGFEYLLILVLISVLRVHVESSESGVISIPSDPNVPFQFNVFCSR